MSFANIETERLFLRRISASDWRGIHAYMSDPNVTAWLPEGTLDENGSKAFAALHAGDEPKAFAATDRQTGETLGHMVFHPYAGTHTYEIGWVFAKAAQGQGYATEAASALLAHAFETLKCHRILATCQPENTASWRVMEKLGMRREGLLRQCIYRGPGLWWDEYVYAILAEEYLGARRKPACYCRTHIIIVMPRFMRCIHERLVQSLRQVSVDGPDKPGHDEGR